MPLGDRRGPRHSVYDLCHPESPEESLHMPSSISTATSHKPHELEYMRLQGVFSKLPDDVCDELVRCYFQHVHFFIPIIDAPAFLNDYCSNGSRDISLLLYWSMLLAAANVSVPCSSQPYLHILMPCPLYSLSIRMSCKKQASPVGRP